ncbi:phospho-N-acetylmuramoyl-pentapeptide-transferase [Quadrisphaera sp. DSM 44207]|uniref:phospho-N-acetylmuramoyl-pentapeptide- transferase n=1 Tax=Quadrisphaera sp. DSM 44207 TaxID=1881057 RepID=UPI0008870734|nr:phospho-N-acetylmuramoyl-pentapeptide-transferase [Quadrisphaera sp. DSM 44207]SDQ53648.1 Phospho-N-acetylmuramoyl-pentapeptide-transferase [Quadrisphaera sp. DSM 44207]
MRAILVAGGVALVISLFGTPLYIRFLVRRGYGQFVRDDGPTTHHTKRGTPTMGGAVIIAATVLGYALAHLTTWNGPTVSGLLVLGLMVGLGFVGFLDDFIKISKQRSLGLRSLPKLIGQTLVALVFAGLALQFPDGGSRTPASTHVSFTRDTAVDFALAGTTVGVVLFVLWALLMIAATSNGVNLTDGLDGLASGATAFVAGAYVLIGIWQSNQSCGITSIGPQCYQTRDPRDLAVVAAALLGACVGFLWWNASPAKIFMGDTGSLALGGALAGLAITSRTELLLVVLGGLFVLITLSVVIQVGSFKLTGRRVFRMAPLQHHFELLGWAEVTIVTRFWIIASLFVAVGLGLFYAEWVVGQ